MKKIKMFYGDSIKNMEEEINKWLEKNKSYKICYFHQTFGNGGTYVSIIYEV